MTDIAGTLPAYVCDLNPNDVLMGRGAPSAEYSGNMKLRQLVLDHRDEYLNCTKRAGKNNISKRIIDTVLKRGGRFLHRVTTMEEARELNIPPAKQAWRVVPPSPPLFIKVKQLMRDVGLGTQEKRRRRREEKKAATKLSSGGDQPVKNVTFPNLSTRTKMSRPAEQAGGKFHPQSVVSPPRRTLKQRSSSIDFNMESSGSIPPFKEPGKTQQTSWHILGGQDLDSTNPSREKIQSDGIAQDSRRFHATETSSAPHEQSSLDSTSRPTAAGPSSDRPENAQSLSPLVNAILWYHQRHQNLYDVLRAVREIEDHPRQYFPQVTGVSTELAKVLFQNLLFPDRPPQQLQQAALQNFAATEEQLTQQDHEVLLLLQDILNRR